MAVVSFALGGCSFSGGHKHTWASTWSTNETQHWVIATCHPDVCNHLGNHEDVNPVDGRCDICGYRLSTEHVHTYAQDWSFNNEQHWHAATCEHTDLKADLANHIDNNNDSICDVCNHSFVDKIVSITISGNLSKTTYNFEDNWDFTGIFVKGNYTSGLSTVLDKADYVLTPSPAKPKNLANSLNINAKLKSNYSISINRVFTEITVFDEVYDETSEINNYYKDCSLTYTGSSLMNELHRHSFSKHTNFVKYIDTTSYLAKRNDFEAPDLIPGEHKTEFFYTGTKTNYQTGSREHVWACNDSSGLWPHGTVDASDYIGGGSDLYHVRPCNSIVNTARGDAPFVDFDHSDFSSYKSSVVEVGDSGPYKLKIYGARKNESGNYEYAHYVEPADEFKGDIARIVAYIYMHYNTNDLTPSERKSMTGGLTLTKVIGFSTVAKAKAILKEWNELDPPSEVEKRRNHTVQQIQGNRNPFVDYPDLINKVF